MTVADLEAAPFANRPPGKAALGPLLHLLQHIRTLYSVQLTKTEIKRVLSKMQSYKPCLYTAHNP